MAILYEFKAYADQRLKERQQQLFRTQYQQYVLGSENWKQVDYFFTLYEGYPVRPPCQPVRADMRWYVDPYGKFGVWVIQAAGLPDVMDKEFGWSPFVRKSTLPVYEPFRVMSVEQRKRIAWIVDEEGYGQYGEVNERGELWVPAPRPADYQ